MLDMHVLNRGGVGMRSPVDGLRMGLSRPMEVCISWTACEPTSRTKAGGDFSPGKPESVSAVIRRRKLIAGLTSRDGRT
jgi:hypothetical protein